MMHGAVTRFAAAFPVHLPMLSQCREGIEMTGGLAICGRIAGDGSDRNRQTKKMSSSVSCVTASVRTSLWLIGFSFVFVLFFSFLSPPRRPSFIIRLGRVWRVMDGQACSFTSSAREWCGYWRTAGSTSATARTTSISACDSSGSQVMHSTSYISSSFSFAQCRRP